MEQEYTWTSHLSPQNLWGHDPATYMFFLKKTKTKTKHACVILISIPKIIVSQLPGFYVHSRLKTPNYAKSEGL